MLLPYIQSLTFILIAIHIKRIRISEKIIQYLYFEFSTQNPKFCYLKKKLKNEINFKLCEHHVVKDSNGDNSFH